jgi:uncharacterized protein YukE
MESSIIRNDLEGLQNLKTNLSSLSNELHDIYNLMNENMRDVGGFWQDAKYQEFVEGYRPQIQKCDEIATRYEEWCSKALQPEINRIIEYEQSNVN